MRKPRCMHSFSCYNPRLWNPTMLLCVLLKCHKVYGGLSASFPGLHAKLLSLSIQKAGEGLEGFIMWCVLLLTSRKLDLISLVSPRFHVAMVARALSVLASSVEKAAWCVQSFCLVKSSYKVILQVTNTGRGGLGRRLVGFVIVTGSEAIEMSSNWFIMFCIFYCISSCRHQSARVTVMGSTTVPTAAFALTTLSQTIRWITRS